MRELNVCLEACENALDTSLLLAERIANFLKDEGVEFERCSNIPHLSLYQFNSENNKQKIIQKELCSIAKDHKPISFLMDSRVEIVGNNIFWRSRAALDNSHLMNLLENVVEKLSLFKSIQPLQQIRDRFDLLSQDQKMLVSKYGVYWGLPYNFDPHITLIYNLSRTDVSIKKSLEKIN